MSERVEASQKTLKPPTIYLDGTRLEFESFGKRFIAETSIGKIVIFKKDLYDVFEGLVAEIRDDKHKTLPTHEEIQEMIGDPLDMKLNSVFLDGFQSGWFNHAEKVLSKLGVGSNPANVEVTQFPDGSVLTRKDYSPKKEKQK